MSRFRITLAQAAGTFDKYMEEKHGRVARAMTKTMDRVKDRIVANGRSNIAAAGFSGGMERGLRGVRFPRRGNSIEAGVWIWHRVPYAGLFEDGGQITGSPLLWLPLSTTMPKLGRRRISPSLLEQKGVELVSMKVRGNTPLLGAAVRLRRSQLTRPKPSLAQLRRGKEGKGVLTTIPLFHGIKLANVKKRIDVRGVAAKEARQIPYQFFYFFNREPE